MSSNLDFSDIRRGLGIFPQRRAHCLNVPSGSCSGFQGKSYQFVVVSFLSTFTSQGLHDHSKGASILKSLKVGFSVLGNALRMEGLCNKVY